MSVFVGAFVSRSRYPGCLVKYTGLWRICRFEDTAGCMMLCSSGKVADIESTTPDVFDGCPSRFICINISEVQDDLFQIAMARKDVAQELEPLPQPRLVPLLFPQRHGPFPTMRRCPLRIEISYLHLHHHLHKNVRTQGTL